jgi:ABC-type Mn2+/Zn2+ transport system ATPase subunit
MIHHSDVSAVSGKTDAVFMLNHHRHFIHDFDGGL